MRYRRKEYEPTPAQIKKISREIRRTWSKERKLSRGGLLYKYRLPTDATTLVRQISPELSAMLDTNDIRDENRCDFEHRCYWWY